MVYITGTIALRKNRDHILNALKTIKKHQTPCPLKWAMGVFCEKMDHVIMDPPCLMLTSQLLLFLFTTSSIVNLPGIELTKQDIYVKIFLLVLSFCLERLVNLGACIYLMNLFVTIIYVSQGSVCEIHWCVTDICIHLCVLHIFAYISVFHFLNKTIVHGVTIDQSYKSHNAPVPYPAKHHSEQKCANLFSEWCLVVCWAGCTFMFRMVYCGMRDRCIVGFARLVHFKMMSSKGCVFKIDQDTLKQEPSWKKWPLDATSAVKPKKAAILQRTFSHAFKCMKMIVLWF